jgi:hypothetical protein
VCYSDASRLELLESARAQELFVLAIDDVEASVKPQPSSARIFPVAHPRACRNRVHYYRLRDLDIEPDAIEREFFLSSLKRRQALN